MTVMIPAFYGKDKLVMQSGLYAVMKPSEQSMYEALSFLSEQKCSRELWNVKAAEVCRLSGIKFRTIGNARKRLEEYGLILCTKGRGNTFSYVLTNPATGQAYPGKPTDAPPKYDPKALEQTIERLRPYLQPAQPHKKKRLRSGDTSFSPKAEEIYGMPSPFGVASHGD
jgi:hypothetical protein